jgi:hypothetical protein
VIDEYKEKIPSDAASEGTTIVTNPDPNQGSYSVMYMNVH